MRRDVFQAIAEPSRRRMMDMLLGRKATISEIAKNFDVSLVAVSKHLKILSECGLVSITQKGREKVCEAMPEKLAEVAAWVASYEAFWTRRVLQLKKVLENNNNKNSPYGARRKGSA